MLKNYFKTAWKNLSKNKVYSFINIAGLSIGLACAMLIVLYLKDDISFDKFHKNVNNIYRIISIQDNDNVKSKMAYTGYFQGPRFTQNVPGIKAFVRVQGNTEDIKIGNEVQSQDLLNVDSNFFSVFTFPLLNGDAKSCLKEPHSIVLTDDAAKKQFGNADAVGKIVMLKDDSTFVPYKVTAVAKTIPQNSSIQFTALVPMKESETDAKDNNNWFNFFLNTYIVLDANANSKRVEKQMQHFFVQDAGKVFQEMKVKYSINGTMGGYELQPFTSMHMSTELPATDNGLTHGNSQMYSYILSGIALFVLLIACINFINLTVARSVKRAKEIGIRKVIGGDRRQLITQFLGESFLLCFIAFVLAILLVQLLLPLFNELANKELSISFLFDAKLVTSYVSLFLLTGLLAGFYPALVLSGYNPVETLYSRFNIKGKNYLQKSLVVLQFTLASFLIIATFTIYAQFNFLTTEKLGYDDSNLIVIDKSPLKHSEAAVFKNELIKNPDITGISAKNRGSWQTTAKNAIDSQISFVYETVDENYLPLLKIPVMQGRNFSAAIPSDSNNSVLVNESFVKQAGWKNPVGETVNFWYNNNEKYHVIGVVKDYHYSSLNEKIIPQLFTMKNGNLYGTYYIKIKPNKKADALKFLQEKFKQFYPLSPYSYVFKDEQNLKDYEAISKWKQILLFGAVLTIFISCIGLFGLSVLSAEKRTKEIGIRKVLGASVNHVVAILSKDFLLLVIIALIISSPLAYMAAGKWLESFPYRITLSWWLFAGAAIMVIFIALFTVSFQAIRAAVSNPVKSLRTE